MPEGVTLDLDSIEGINSLKEFSVYSSHMGDNTYRVVIVSFNGGVIPVLNKNKSVLRLPVAVDDSVAIGNYELAMTNVVMSNLSGENVSSTPSSIGSISIVSTEGVNEFSSNITMYPNPTSEFINLNIRSEFNGAVYFSIYDMTGKLVLRLTIHNNYYFLDSLFSIYYPIVFFCYTISYAK